MSLVINVSPNRKVTLGPLLLQNRLYMKHRLRTVVKTPFSRVISEGTCRGGTSDPDSLYLFGEQRKSARLGLGISTDLWWGGGGRGRGKASTTSEATTPTHYRDSSGSE